MKIPGVLAATVTVTGMESAVSVVPLKARATRDAMVFGASVVGTCAFTWPEPAKNNGISTPPMVSVMPASVVGNGKPLLGVGAVASVAPKTEMISPGETWPFWPKLAPFTTPAVLTCGGGLGLAATVPGTAAETIGKGELITVTVTVAGLALLGFHVAE